MSGEANSTLLGPTNAVGKPWALWMTPERGDWAMVICTWSEREATEAIGRLSDHYGDVAWAVRRHDNPPWERKRQEINGV